MNSIFSEDSMFMNILFRISDVVALNVLFLLTCLPVFTIGAALTALNYTAITAIKYEDGYIAKKYFKSFISNFKQSTLVWLIMLFVGCILFFDAYFWVSYWKLQHSPWIGVMIIVSVVMAFVFLMAFVWIFPILSKFSNTIGKSIWNALALSVRHFPWTLLLCVTAALVPLFSYLSFPFLVAMVVCGFGALAYAYAFLFQHIFKQYLTDASTETEEDGEQAGMSKGLEKNAENQEANEDASADSDNDQTVSDNETDKTDNVAAEANENKTDETDSAAAKTDENETAKADALKEKKPDKKSTAGTVKRKGRTVQYINSYEGEDADSE